MTRLSCFEAKHDILHPILAFSFINFVLMMLVLMMATSIFAKPSGVEMQFSSSYERGSRGYADVVIMITSENVIYVDDRVVTFNELRRFLAQGDFRHDALMIKTDRRASMGRVIDVLDLCRGIAGASVHVATIL